MRRLFALSSTLFLTLACGKDDDSEAGAECQLQAIDLSACQRSSLATLQPEGVWNMNVVLEDGSGAAGALRISSPNGVPLALGMPVTEKQVSEDTFFMASEVKDSYGRTVRFAFAGCQAVSPSQLAGIFRRCVDGKRDIQGTFDAVRVSRRNQEAEASGVELVGEKTLPRGTPVEVAVAGTRAFVAAGTEGLFIYDVSAPAQLKDKDPAGYKGADDGAYNDVLVHGDTLYVATKNKGIVILDVSAPGAPARVRSLPERPVEVQGLALSGNLLFAASPSPEAEVLIYDVTNPRAPALVHRYLVEGSNPDLGQVPLDVTASNGRLYVSHWNYGLTVSDVTTPAKPKLLGRHALSNSRSAAVGTVGSRTLAFDVGLDWGAHLRQLDMTVPESVAQVGEFRLRQEVSPSRMALAGTKLYVAYHQDGLRILDVSVVGELRQVAYYNSWREGDAGRGAAFFDGLNAVAVPGDGYVYATDSSRGLMVFRETP
jgi:hypothetical protein